MGCFIKKIWENRGEEVHDYFVRFSKGRFENRAVLNLQKSSKIKLRGSFEWANDFVQIVSELGEINFSGIILSKDKLDLDNEKKKKAISQYDVENLSSEKIREIKDRAYCMLLDAETEDIKLKMKKKLPKPGKNSKKKADDKFCQLEADLKYWPKIKEAFMLPECKRCKINHTFIIEQIVFPEEEKDFAEIREMARRKGKIIRKLEIDKQEKQEEKEFVA